MHIHLIIGPTGVGKTVRAVQLALQLRAPVVVLDRVQIYPELATGSGRPLNGELQGTVRYYLAERRISEGELQVREGLQLLQTMIAALAPKHRHLIIEGGSISLSQALWNTGCLLKHQLSVTYLTIGDRQAYRQLVYERVKGMLKADPAITDELATAWSTDAAGRRLVQKVVGYDALLTWCLDTGLAPQELPRLCRDSQIRAALVTAITQAHLAYAAQQQRIFTHLLCTYETSFSMEFTC